MHCTLCPTRKRIPNRPPVCDACRSWLAGVLGDIRIHTEQLGQPDQPIRDDRRAPVRDPDDRRRALRNAAGNVVLCWRDPAAHGAPAGDTPGQKAGPRIGHTRPKSRPPLALDPVDLALRSRRGSLPLYGRDAQVGFVPVATVLEAWVLDWIPARGQHEHRPEPTAAALTRWLVDRLDWACDEYDLLVSFADDMRTYRTALRRVLGESDRDERKKGVRCGKCQLRTLFRRNGSLWVECGSCDALLSPEEYTAITNLQAAVLA